MKQCFCKFIRKFKDMFLSYGSLILGCNFFASSYFNFEERYFMPINRANDTDSEKVSLGSKCWKIKKLLKKMLENYATVWSKCLNFIYV